MNLIAQKMSEILPDWNKRVLTVADAEAFAQARGVITVETDLIEDLGEYRVYKEKPFIFIHSFVTERVRPWVYWHEIGHDILHTPLSCKFASTSTKRKVEIEANIIAAIALIPLELTMTKTLWEIQEEYGYPRELIMFRKKILDNHCARY